MKKIILSTIILLTSAICFAQFPQKRIITNNQTNAVFEGAAQTMLGLVNGVYADTTAANAGYIDFYNGAQIWTRSDRNFWLRDSVLNMWIRMAKYNDFGVSTGYGILNTGTSQLSVLSADTSSTNSLVTQYDLSTAIGSVPTGWGLTGNAGTTPVTNFLGTTDNKSLYFRTNNIYRGKIDSNGTWLINKDAAFTSGGDALVIRAFDNNTFHYPLYVENSTGSGIFYIEGNSRINFASFSNSVWGGSSSIDMTNATVDATNINFAGYSRYAHISTPVTPASGFGNVYMNSDSLRFINDNNEVFTLGRNYGGITSETDPLSIHLTGTSTLTGNITVDGLTNSKRIFINGKGSGNSGVDIYAEGGFASMTSNIGNYIGASGNDSAYIYLAGRTKFNDNAYSTSNTIQKDAPLTTLKVIGSNQTITFPYYGNNGYMIVLQNQNNSAFSWLTAGAPVVKPDGTSITSIPNQSISWYMWDDVSGSPTINSWVQFSLFDATAATTLYKARTKSKGLVIEFTTASENIGMWKTPYDITISSVEAVLVGSSSPSVTFQINFGSDRTSGTAVYTSGRTVTSTTTGSTFNSSFNDATIPAGSFIWVTTSAQSGTVTQIELTINYTED